MLIAVLDVPNASGETLPHIRPPALARRHEFLENLTNVFMLSISAYALRGPPVITVVPPKRALVVDDDAGIRILVSRILTRRGFLVEAVRDGAEAIEKLGEHDYALVTLDLMMPRIDGFGVMKYLTRYRPEMVARVIVMTAFGSKAMEQIDSPGVRFIEKPFDIERLLEEAARCAVAEQ